MIKNNNGQVAVAYLDGYSLAERLLEGVRFEMREVDGKLTCTGVHPEDADYMIQFSEQARADWETTAPMMAVDSMFDEDGNDCWWEDA